MQKTEFRDRVVGLALDLAWSLWAELSVSGWTRSHTSTAVDLEALILHTAWLGRFDRRLMNESVDWCISNSSLVSGVRLKNLLRRATDEVEKSFADYSATVKIHERVPWPGDGTAWRMIPSGKSGVVDLERPALIQLKLRAIFGVSARSEALKLLLSAPDRSWTGAELATLAAYGKDNVTGALSRLASAGLVNEEKVGNGFRYGLRRHAQLKALLGELPGRFPLWATVFPIVESLVRFAHATSDSRADVRAVEAGGVLRRIDDGLRVLGLVDSMPAATGTNLNHQFDVWAVQLLRQWAHIADPAAGEVGEGHEAIYTVNRLTLPPGAWMGVVLDPEESAKPLQMPEWSDIYDEHPRSDMIISDDSTGAPRVAHEMMRLAEKRAGNEIGDYWGGDFGLNQLVARAFAEEQLWPMRHGTSMTWGETYLRTWRRDRVQRLEPTHARPRKTRQT
jgi:hypothetical protein